MQEQRLEIRDRTGTLVLAMHHPGKSFRTNPPPDRADLFLDLTTELHSWDPAGKVKGGKKPTVATVRKQVQQALTRQFMKTLFRYEIHDGGGVPTLTYETDAAALTRLIRVQLGKTILFTDNDDWSTEEIILGYRSQYHIENAFRQMKDPHFLGWTPMFHWTDSKIRVHAFICVLALLLSSLLQRTLHQEGVALSIPGLFEILGDIQEAAVIYPRRPGQRHPTMQTCLTPLSAEQETLLDKLKLRQYLLP